MVVTPIRLRWVSRLLTVGERARGLRRDGTDQPLADVSPKPQAKADRLW
jgi:hypothetical protein